MVNEYVLQFGKKYSSLKWIHAEMDTAVHEHSFACKQIVNVNIQAALITWELIFHVCFQYNSQCVGTDTYRHSSTDH